MDEQVVDLIRDQFASMNGKIDSMGKTVHDKIDGLSVTMREHVNKDDAYWKKIDAQQAQIGVIGYLLSLSGLGAAFAWAYHKFISN